jgi:SAM-dependent methyltransferase
MAEFEQALRAYCTSGAGGEDASITAENVETHLRRRLEADRRVFVPWLDAVCKLPGARVLEIGCGTGASTVALAEQGAEVVGLDLSEPAISLARQRCAAYGVSAEFHRANAVEAPALFADRSFDLIVFFASLEHMTHAERLQALAGAWGMLAPGRFLGLVETPNRLWYVDNHTSLLPFFLWLPDDLAMAYSRFSPRSGFRERYAGDDPSQITDFLREGRGVSYHEFELALQIPAEQLPVASSLGTHHPLLERLRRWRPARPLDTRYRALLEEIYPGLDRGFLFPSLDLLLRKP